MSPSRAHKNRNTDVISLVPRRSFIRLAGGTYTLQITRLQGVQARSQEVWWGGSITKTAELYVVGGGGGGGGVS